MLKQRLRVARTLLVLAAVLGTTAACSGGSYTPTPAPYVGPTQAQPMDIPQGGG